MFQLNMGLSNEQGLSNDTIAFPRQSFFPVSSNSLARTPELLYGPLPVD